MIAFETNVLAYAEGVDDARRRDIAKGLVVDHQINRIVIPAQVLAELYTVLVRKGRRTPDDAKLAIKQWAAGYTVVATTADLLQRATELAGDHRIAWWDAIVLAAAAEANCRVLFSEDMRGSFTWRGVTVRNPFAG